MQCKLKAIGEKEPEPLYPKGSPSLRPVDTCIFDRYEQVNNILNYIYDIFGQNEESLFS